MNSFKKDKHDLKLRLFYFLLAIFPIGAFYWVIFKCSINIPYYDDFNTVFSFIIQYFEKTNIKEKILLILSQHNEHRIAFLESVVLVNYYLFHEVDLKLITIFGNISIFGLFALLFLNYKKRDNRYLYFIPVSFLLFQPQYWQGILWVSAALTYLPAIYFDVLETVIGTDVVVQGAVEIGVFAHPPAGIGLPERHIHQRCLGRTCCCGD